jgi:hypothetical protein
LRVKSGGLFDHVTAKILDSGWEVKRPTG